MKMHTDAARLLVHRAANMASTGKKFENGEGSMSKLYAGENAVWVTEQAIQILGGYGYVRENPVEQWHRDSKIYTIFEGPRRSSAWSSAGRSPASTSTKRTGSPPPAEPHARPGPYTRPTMEHGRLEAFSDGVVAVAITLLALNLAVGGPGPRHPSLLHQLGHQWPVYAAYVVSFFTIGVIWVNHHSLFRQLAGVDRPTLFLNLLLLLFVVAIPFGTSTLADYLPCRRPGRPGRRRPLLRCDPRGDGGQLRAAVPPRHPGGPAGGAPHTASDQHRPAPLERGRSSTWSHSPWPSSRPWPPWPSSPSWSPTTSSNACLARARTWPNPGPRAGEVEPGGRAGISRVGHSLGLP